jgi:hypothetical protein
MPPYDLINSRYFWFMMAAGVGIAVLVILARGVSPYTFSLRKRSDQQIDEDVHEFGGGVREKDSPVPLLLWLLVPSVLLWAVGYIIYSGAYGL